VLRRGRGLGDEGYGLRASQGGASGAGLGAERAQRNLPPLRRGGQDVLRGDLWDDAGVRLWGLKPSYWLPGWTLCCPITHGPTM
jgi:hypothetical protein